MNTISQLTINIIIMGGVQGLFFAFLLSGLRGGRIESNRILVALLMAVSIGMFSVAGLVLQTGPVLSRILRLFMLMSTGFIPLLYLYIKTLVTPETGFSAKQVWHFFPILLIICSGLIFCGPEYDLANYFPGVSIDHVTFTRGIWILYALPYLFCIYRLLKHHAVYMVAIYRHTGILDQEMHYKMSVYVWVRSLLTAGSIYWVFSLVFLLTRGFLKYSNVIALLVTVIIYVLGFLGSLKPELFFRFNFMNDRK